jgi:glycosyltransferase involved in cell wall biosynthesis
MPAFNRAHFIGRALESALSQTHPPDEIVVVDDGSTDNTSEIIAGFGEKVRYFRQNNAGPSSARNCAIREARCDFVALLDSDDLWSRDRLEKQVALLERHPELDVIFGLESKFDTEDGLKAPEINHEDYFEFLDSVPCPVPDPVQMLLRENFFIATSSVVFRRACVERVGYFDEKIRLAEDYEYWLRFALAGSKFGFINAVLCRRRLHEGNLIKETLATKASVAEVLDHHRGDLSKYEVHLTRKLRGLHYDLGSAYLSNGEWGKAYEHLKAGEQLNESGMRWRAKLAAASLLRLAKSNRAPGKNKVLCADAGQNK